MNKNIRGLLLLIVLSLFASACMFFPEKEGKLQYVYDLYGLDLDPHKTVYLRHNLWYENPDNIDVRYFKGKILPFGTKVKFIEAYPGYAIFEVLGNNKTKYKVNNDQEITFLPDEVFFKRIFTQENPIKDFKNSGSKDIAALKKGKIYKGMTRQEVLLAYGPPPVLFNANYRKKTTWLYQLDNQYRLRHVVFKDNKVVYVFDL